MLKHTPQHYEYWKHQIRTELSKFLKLMIVIVYILIPFQIVEAIRKAINPLAEFFLSFMFWSVVMLLILYWMPNKKEYKEWVEKNHSI